jgi:hypothetical protein
MPLCLHRRCWTEVQLNSVDAEGNVGQWLRNASCRLVVAASAWMSPTGQLSDLAHIADPVT